MRTHQVAIECAVCHGWWTAEAIAALDGHDPVEGIEMTLDDDGQPVPTGRMHIVSHKGEELHFCPPITHVGTAEFADRLGVSRQRISQLRKSDPNFPKPLQYLSLGRRLPVWSTYLMESYARRREAS